LPEPWMRLWTWGFIAHGFVYPALPTIFAVGPLLDWGNLLTGAIDVPCEGP
jgi:hypothetical protein